ncbi:MAG: DUF1573 domain-containing protein [Bacteroidetes bacterium]|nr:DUF1573 domain-containing protein [Bacteroidota bacterium]
MKSIFFTFFALVGFSLFAQQDGGLNLSVEGGAQIVFENEVVDYGTIEQGSDGQREFVFTNTGKEPLIISNCKGSCGCTVPKCPTEPVLPGETAKIKVKYDTNRVGAFTKTVTITSNAGEATKTVTIKGTVLAKETAPASAE